MAMIWTILQNAFALWLLGWAVATVMFAADKIASRLSSPSASDPS